VDELSLCEVTRENWRATLQLAVDSEQQRFVAASIPITAIALAKAYIRPKGLTWIPYAFYVAGDIIGFTELAYEPASVENYWLFHFFIDHCYQGRGYGKQALRLFIQFLKENHAQCEALQLTVHPENDRAQRLYKSIGFRPTGAEIDDEPAYKLTLKP